MSSNRIIVAMVGVVVLAVAFWMLLIAPKRTEVSELDQQVTQQQELLSVHQAEVTRALEARESFPSDYQELVVLGKAAPADDDTASLLVQLDRIANRAGVRFQTFTLASEGGGEEAPAPEAAPAESADGEGVPAENPTPTEVAASTLPLGAKIGPAGLAVMPYTLNFQGNFFQIADFIKGLDALVRTKNSKVEVTGRLITINGFTLAPDSSGGFPGLEGSFSVSTFLVQPGQGVTGGATPISPEEATQVATTTGGTP
jgi:Tfp pilus assembly protein PilO